MKPKKKKKPSVSRLRRKADKLWSHKIWAAHGMACVICGGQAYINAHHIEDRTNLILRWDVINGICLCPLHHKFGKDSAHKSMVFIYDWISANRPLTLEHIRKRRNDRIEITRDLLADVILQLQQPLTDNERQAMGLPPQPTAVSQAAS